MRKRYQWRVWQRSQDAQDRVQCKTEQGAVERERAVAGQTVPTLTREVTALTRLESCLFLESTVLGSKQRQHRACVQAA